MTILHWALQWPGKTYWHFSLFIFPIKDPEWVDAHNAHRRICSFRLAMALSPLPKKRNYFGSSYSRPLVATLQPQLLIKNMPSEDLREEEETLLWIKWYTTVLEPPTSNAFALASVADEPPFLLPLLSLKLLLHTSESESHFPYLVLQPTVPSVPMKPPLPPFYFVDIHESSFIIALVISQHVYKGHLISTSKANPRVWANCKPWYGGEDWG